MRVPFAIVVFSGVLAFPLSGTAASGSTITSPTSPSTLTSASTTFTWNAGPAGTTGYGLNVGTSLGAANLVNIGPLSGTTATVTLPTNGATIYVRLWTIVNGTTYLYNDYTYTEFTRFASVIASPTPGNTLTSASTTFTWNAGPAGTTYGLNVGTSLGGADLVNIGPLSGTSTTVKLPTNGTKIYVRLWTIFNGSTYLSNDYTYTEFSQSGSVISSPTPGGTLTSASTTFTWNAGPAGTTGYGLNVGTSPGGANLVNIYPLSGTSTTVNLPTNGTTIYVRLWTVINGTTFLSNDYTYTEFTQSPAAITSPAPGSTLTSASTTFTWNAGPAGTTGYGLNVGTSPGGADLVNIGPLSGTSVTVNLPTNGITIYVRLWTILNGTTYLYNDYTYTEPGNPLAISTSSLPSGVVGTAYSATLAATGGTTPFTWSLTSGTLPAGLSLNATTGAISGTPTATANATALTFKLTDSSSPAQTKSANLTLTIASAPLSITTTSLPSGVVGTAYSATLAATGGTTPFTWSLTSGKLPAGLSLNATTGAISGTPTATANATALTFKLTDSSSPAQTKSVNLTLTIASATTVSVSPKRAGVAVTQTLSVTPTTGDTAGVNWSASGSSCSGNTCGSFSSAQSLTGVAVTYSAPSVAGLYTITATSITNGSVSATVAVAVTDLSGVSTYHNNASRNGANTQEYALTTASVTTATFAKIFSCTVDGAIYAQPLWVPNLTISSTKRNVVFVATQHDSLYAFDADSSTSPCTPLWHTNLIDSAHGGISGETSVPSSGSGALVGSGYGDIAPEVGVTGTPVIDLTTNTLYIVSKSVIASGPSFYQRLHAIDLATGNEKFSGPVTIAATYPGTGDGGTTTTFVARGQNQRAGLALANGIVYIAWASHEDSPPYYGWVIGYNASDLSQASVFNDAPNVGFGGIWMSGGAPSIDSSGNLYLITGNAYFDATNSSAPNNDYGDSFLKMTSALSVSQYFTPSDQATDNIQDSDFGAGGAAILVDLPVNGTNPTHLVIGGGKDGALYLLDRDKMGGVGDTNAWQETNVGGGIFSTGAFWNSNFYLAPVGSALHALSLSSSTAKLSFLPNATSTTFGFEGATPSVSSMPDNSNGIVWALDVSQYCTPQSPGCGPAVIHAYNATNLATELWNSTQGIGNTAGNAVKFTVPTVANGKVYIGTRGNNAGGADSSTSIPGELDVYGLLPN